ncbi:transcriptional regulator [Roseibium aquae]|uniref:Transcriptional regulator n=1 Tax=Roseibium aquae TaxID=1323746 RepID=A0A916TAP7_9HYPH|nr:MarR family transcriptional regulator [Roseibium aquae]GGB38246.1 transcriptional regulator [Roseibium aquae]
MSPSAPSGGANWMIVDIARLLRRRFETALADVETGLTVAEARALAFVWRNPGLRQATLAERMGVEPMTLVGYLDALEKAALVRRESDPTDRRAKLVRLTRKADPILERIETVMDRVRSDALGNLSECEHATLERLLATIKTSLCEKDKKEPETRV